MVSRLGDKVSVTGIKDADRSGRFEVQIVGGKLLHSKKGGDGFVDNDEKLEKIIKGIEEAIAAQ